PLAGGHRREEHGPGGHGLPDAGRRHLRPDVAQRVVHAEHRARVSALAVDVELDVAVRIDRLQMQQLRHQGVRDARVDAGAEIDDPLAEQMRVDVHDPLAARVLRDDVRNGVGAHREAPSTARPMPMLRCTRGAISSKELTTASMNPYSSASRAVYQRSCSESSKTRSTLWPVSSAMRPSTVSRVCRRSSACSSMSAAVPAIPAEPWCIRTRAWGMARRFPGVPAESRNWPALHARPSARVDTSQGTSRIVSRIASIEGTEPPGEWIHSAMSAEACSVARAIIWVASRVPLSSSRAPSSTSTRWRYSSRRARSSNMGGLVVSLMPPRCARARPDR